MIKKLFFFIGIGTLFQLQVEALPLEDIYCQRVIDALHWHQKYSFCEHLTDKRIEEIQPLIQDIFSLEQKYHSDYFQLIVGQNSTFVAYQILLKELYKVTKGQDFPNYEFFRPLKDDKLFLTFKDLFQNYPGLLKADEIFQFYKEYPELLKPLLSENEYQKIWEPIPESEKQLITEMKLDNTAEISYQLVSASFTLETNAPMDSAIDVFSNCTGMALDNSISKLIPQLVAEVAYKEGIEDINLLSQLEELVSLFPKSNEGTLLQVFIPKYLAENMIYIAYGGGLVDIDSTQNIESYFCKIENLRESPNFNCRFPYQARLLVGALDPDHVIIKRHTMIAPDELDKYKQLVQSFWQNLVN